MKGIDMKIRTAAIFCVCLILMIGALPASAQDEVSDHTRTFVEKATLGNMFEIRSSEVALDRSDRAEVRSFAHAMLTDHTNAGRDLKAVLAAADLDIQPPINLDPAHQQIVNALVNANENEVDLQYIRTQIEAHDKAVALFEDYAANGDDPALRQFASDTLPVLIRHARHIKRMGDGTIG